MSNNNGRAGYFLRACVCMWIFKWHFWLNFFPQPPMSHEKQRSSGLWLNWWRLRRDWCEKRLPQPGWRHMYGASLVCVYLWYFSE